MKIFNVLIVSFALGLGACVGEEADPIVPNQNVDVSENNGVDGDPVDDVVVEPCVDRPICLDAPAPQYSLTDFQSHSPRFGEAYGLEGFGGKVTVVAMLAGWCGFCQSQALQMEVMQAELLEEGFDVNFVAVNDISASSEADQNKLAFLKDDSGEVLLDEETGEPVPRCTFPLLQDVEEVGAWDLHEVSKDDIIIYSAQGTLKRFLARGGAVNTTLSNEAGYNAVKEAIIGAF